MLAGGGTAPNEGHFRPIEIVTRAGNASSTRCIPRPCFLYGWIGDQSIEAIYQAVGQAHADGRPRVQRRRHLRARLVGDARAHRRAVDGRRAAPDRAGRDRCTATARTA